LHSLQKEAERLLSAGVPTPISHKQRHSLRSITRRQPPIHLTSQPPLHQHTISTKASNTRAYEQIIFQSFPYNHIRNGRPRSTLRSLHPIRWRAACGWQWKQPYGGTSSGRSFTFSLISVRMLQRKATELSRLVRRRSLGVTAYTGRFKESAPPGSGHIAKRSKRLRTVHQSALHEQRSESLQTTKTLATLHHPAGHIRPWHSCVMLSVSHTGARTCNHLASLCCFGQRHVHTG